MAEQDYTIDQVASIIQVHRKTVEEWIATGQIEAYTPSGPGGNYRITPEALDRFRENRKVKPRRTPRKRRPAKKSETPGSENGLTQKVAC